MTTPLRYLLDTNILSDLVRHPRGIVAQVIARVGESQVCTSVVVSGELRFGAAKSTSPRLLKQVEDVLSAIEILPPGIAAGQVLCGIASCAGKNRHARWPKRPVDRGPCAERRPHTGNGKRAGIFTH